MGVFSSPLLDLICRLEKRELLSVDNNPEYIRQSQQGLHRVQVVENWDQAEIDRPWDVAFVDHSPSERRVVELRRLAKLAQYVVLHDTNHNFEQHYHYSEIYPLFKYGLVFDAIYPSTTVLSNFRSLDGFWHRTNGRNVEW